MKTFLLFLATGAVAFGDASDFAVSGIKCPGDAFSHFGTNQLAPGMYNLFSNFTTNALVGDPIPFSYYLVQHRSDGYTPSLAAVAARWPDVCQKHDDFWPTHRWTLVGSNSPAGAFSLSTTGKMAAGKTAALWQAYPMVGSSPSLTHARIVEADPLHSYKLHDEPPPYIRIEPPSWDPNANLIAVGLPGAAYEVYAGADPGGAWSYATNFTADAYGFGESGPLDASAAVQFWKVVCTNVPAP